MTKKDYQLVADTIKQTRARFPGSPTGFDSDSVAQLALDVLAENLGHRLKLDNPRFDAAKFQEACR